MGRMNNVSKKMLNKFPWYDFNEYKNIHRVIVKIFYKENIQIKTKEFKDILRKDFILDEYLDNIYEMVDNYGSWFDHLIRNARTSLEMQGLLKKLPNRNGYKATDKLLSSDLKKEVEIFDNFKKSLPYFFKSGTKFKEWKKELKKAKKIKDIQKIIKINPVVLCLRSKFQKALDEEFKQYKDNIGLIDDYKKTFDSNLNIKVFDRAHIIPVSYLAQDESRWNDIANPNNGLILDPNTHRLLDNDKDTYFSNDCKKIISKRYRDFQINENFINKERKIFIKEYKEKIQSFKK